MCGKPAKGTVLGVCATRNGLVCGVHARSATTQYRVVVELLRPQVRVGQVWRDADKRSDGRRLLVVAVDATHATVTSAERAGRRTRIRLDRFRPTSNGYRLERDA
jgi:hypothetical protein